MGCLGVAMADLGRLYQDGEIIVREGDPGDCMYVVQKGRVDVIANFGGDEVVLRSLGRNDFFGEMALFERDVRTSTARAAGQARILTVDRRTFLRGISEDPSLALRMVKIMSHRIKDLTGRLAAYENPLSEGRARGSPVPGDGARQRIARPGAAGPGLQE